MIPNPRTYIPKLARHRGALNNHTRIKQIEFILWAILAIESLPGLLVIHSLNGRPP